MPSVSTSTKLLSAQDVTWIYLNSIRIGLTGADPLNFCRRPSDQPEQSCYIMLWRLRKLAIQSGVRFTLGAGFHVPGTVRFIFALHRLR